jgi:TRAP-type C4-dicarboxylate transport system permease small subunit
MVVGGTRLVLLTAQLGQTAPALGIPMSLVYAVVPISGLLIIYYRIPDLLPRR